MPALQKPQQTFLEEVARDLYDRYGNQLSRVRMLFPSRRARLFFVDALSRMVQHPIWQPRPTSVDELMEQISGLHTADKLRLVTELYRVYSRYRKEPFDKFYFWGEMLLSDFDMIDKYRIDAEQLFRNISDLKELEADISYLTPEQMQIIRDFWSHLNPDDDLSEEKRRFLEIWRKLYSVYTDYRERLQSLGIAYGGMVQRAAAERLDRGEFSFEEPMHFAVVGFNALTSCEKRLFAFLQANAKTDFYWDCDSYYTRRERHEAGMFMRRNLVDFPPTKDLMTNALAAPTSFCEVAAVSNAVQCKYSASILSEWVKSNHLDKETAVVLTDENLLMPLLYALPEAVGKVNVTMGYPLRQTLAYTFVERLIELQANVRAEHGEHSFYYTDVQGLLSHPYLVTADRAKCAALQQDIVQNRRIRILQSSFTFHPLVEQVFRSCTSWQAMSDWLLEVIGAVAREPHEGEDGTRRNEFLAVVAEEIAKLRNSLDNCDIELKTDTYTSLLRRHLQTVRIPFRGEPLEGVQVMGILETRALDFKRVVILSMTDDNFPGNHMSQASFIPYNLRSAFGLPTPEHHEGVYAYYFYRLIQRAEEVVMLYCSHADDKSTGEPSRYIRQIGYESGHTLRKVEVGVDVNLIPTEPIEVEKSEEVMRRLARFVVTDEERAQKKDGEADLKSRPSLSPSALANYVKCPLSFYFASVACIKEEEVLEEEVDSRLVGNVLHDAAQILYTSVVGEHRPGKTLEAKMRAGDVERAVERAIEENCLKRSNVPLADYPGQLLLVRDIVVRYLRKGVLAYDCSNDDFRVLGCEEKVGCTFAVQSGEQALELRIGGRADRLDCLGNGLLRVVDYKTSAPHLEFKSLDSLFFGPSEERCSHKLQTLLYSMMLCRSFPGRDAQPTLYYARRMHSEEYSPNLIERRKEKEEDRSAKTIADGAPYSYYADHFERLLHQTLAELYDPSVPFRQCEDRATCEYCNFKAICRR